MRWVFIVLIFFNVLGWYWFSSVVKPEAIVEGSGHKEWRAEPGVNRLMLLGEIGGQSKVGISTAGQVPSGKAELVVESLASSLEGAGGPEQRMSELMPLSESNVSSEEEGGCSSIGPFVAEASVDSIRARLSELEIEADKIVREIVVREVYWLMIPTSGSVEQAAGLLQELKGKKIDSFLIEDGEFVNSISLGVFGSRGNAEGYRASLIGKGYLPEITPLPRFENQYWLSISGFDLSKLSGGFWLDISQLEGDMEVGVEEVSCE